MYNEYTVRTTKSQSLFDILALLEGKTITIQSVDAHDKTVKIFYTDQSIKKEHQNHISITKESQLGLVSLERELS